MRHRIVHWVAYVLGLGVRIDGLPYGRFKPKSALDRSASQRTGSQSIAPRPINPEDDGDGA